MSFDQQSWERGAAYLAMWSALESLDPEHDRWSEPDDFGDTAKRLKAADDRLDQSPNVDQPDIEKYRETVKALQSKKTEYTAGIRIFARQLRDKGSAAADAGIIYANTGAAS